MVDHVQARAPLVSSERTRTRGEGQVVAANIGPSSHNKRRARLNVIPICSRDS